MRQCWCVASALRYVALASTVDAALDALRKDPHAQFTTKGGWTIVATDENGNHVLWSFTPEGHAAHPAAVRRTVLEKDGAVFIVMKVLCFGTQAACDKLVEEFKQLNERIKQATAVPVPLTKQRGM